MKWTTLVLVFALVFAGSCAKPTPHLAPVKPTFTDLSVEESGVVESEDAMDITIPAFDPLTAAGPADQLKARFRGTDRKGAKTTIADAALKSFEDLRALVASLPSDTNMLHHTPVIARDTMTRATEENRNVRVVAWIYAIKYETDQDFHVILGTDPADGSKTFFNAEVSGLPANSAAAFARLQEARNSLAVVVDHELPAGSGYRKYNAPIAVKVEGSLFFDVDHAAGVVGPSGMRPATAWEIHPVTNLTSR